MALTSGLTVRTNSFGYVNQRMFRAGRPTQRAGGGRSCQYPDPSAWTGPEEHGHEGSRYCYVAGSATGGCCASPTRTGPSTATRWAFGAVRPSSSVTGSVGLPGAASTTRDGASVANFRRAPCLGDGMRIRLQASNGQYGRRPEQRRRPGSREPGPAQRLGRLHLTDLDGGCLESGDTVALRTSDGFYLRADGEAARR